MGDEIEVQQTPLTSHQLRIVVTDQRDRALKHAVAWCTWAGSQASDVVATAVHFASFLETGDFLDEDHLMAPDIERAEEDL